MTNNPPAAALPDGAAPPAPPPPRALSQQSMSQRIRGYLRYYDADGNGVLDGDEQAHALGDLARSRDAEKRSTDVAILMAVRNTRLNIWLVLALVGMVIATLVFGDRAFSDVNGSIERTAITAVTVDPAGAAHLVDKSSGVEMSTRGTGDLYSARQVEVWGRVLHCIPVSSAADMVDSLAQGANVRLALLDRDGSLEERIVSLGVDFEDAGDVLHFGDGRVDVLLDDDSCNVREGQGKEGEEGEEEGTKEEEGDGERIFGGRGLGPAARPPRESVLARNRAIYGRARKGVRAGGQRVLDGQGGDLVPVFYFGAGGDNASPLPPPTMPPAPPPTPPPTNVPGKAPTMPPAPNAGPPTMPPAPIAGPTPPPTPPTPIAGPTPPPTPPACSPSEDRITVEVTTDEYPDLTEWWFYNGCTGSTKIQANLFSESYTGYSESFCESGGQYTFNIQSFGFQFSGSYTVTLNGQVIKQGGAFQWYETTQFGPYCN